MAKLYVQSMDEVWITSASIPASGSVTSGSFPTRGHARLVGICIAAASAASSNGLQISQSCDSGSNWDYSTIYVPTASSGSAYSIEIVGNAAKITYRTDGNGASIFRTAWYLRPI